MEREITTVRYRYRHDPKFLQNHISQISNRYTPDSDSLARQLRGVGVY